MNIGYFYFIKPSYFTDFANSNIMSNRDETDEQQHKRPCFYAFTSDNHIFWLVPISSKVDKFERIYDTKIKRYGKCDTIDFCSVLGRKKAVLIQNMFPVTAKYVLNEYLDPHHKPVQVCSKVHKRIIHKAKKVLELQRKGIDLIFGNVLEIEKDLLSLE